MSLSREQHLFMKTTDSRTSQREFCALKHLGPGMVTVVDHLPDEGTLFLELVEPGYDLGFIASTDDDLAIEILAQLIVEMQSLQTVEEVGYAQTILPHLREVMAPLRRIRDDRLPSGFTQRALAMGKELVAEESSSTLVLHGDLHPGNVLWDAGSRRWRVIDPHGWVGDQVFEAVVSLCVPGGLGVLGDARGCDPVSIIRRLDRRISIICEMTGFDRDRLNAWTFVGAVIAEARMLEHHNLVHGAALALAEGLHDRTR